MEKKTARLRRAARTRKKFRVDDMRLVVHKTPNHIYAQLIKGDGSVTLAQASTLDKKLRTDLKSTGNVEAAKQVGKLIAERALEAGISDVAFDRSGFAYHGRVKALADAAREAGLKF
jgi:large subunit ribosomal protein L18